MATPSSRLKQQQQQQLLTCPVVQQWQVRQELAVTSAPAVVPDCRLSKRQLSAVAVYPAELWPVDQRSLVLAPTARHSPNHADCHGKPDLTR